MLHPHVPEELKHFGKHLFATFLGLLMALGLEQWREHRHDAQIAREALEAVQVELQEDVAGMEANLKRCDTSLESLARLDQALDGRWPVHALPGFGPEVLRDVDTRADAAAFAEAAS